MKPPGWKSTIPEAAVGFIFRNSQFIYTFYKFCANNFIIPDQPGAYNILHQPYSRREKTSQVERKRNDFTSGMKWSVFTSKASLFLVKM